MQYGKDKSYCLCSTDSISWDIEGGYLDSSPTLKSGVKNITFEYQEDLDEGAERDAGYVYGPATPGMFTI